MYFIHMGDTGVLVDGLTDWRMNESMNQWVVDRQIHEWMDWLVGGLIAG